MELSERLDLFMSSGQISEASYKALLRVIDMFKQQYGLILTEENGAMFITHLSIAGERIKRQEFVEPVDKEIYKEIENDPDFGKAEQVFAFIQQEMNISIPDNEKGYIMLHLCTLFKLK